MYSKKKCHGEQLYFCEEQVLMIFLLYDVSILYHALAKWNYKSKKLYQKCIKTQIIPKYLLFSIP